MYTNDMGSVVFDVGSRTTKMGFGGESSPKVALDSVIGRQKKPGVGLKDYYIGAEIAAKRGILKLRWPVEHGMITQWREWEQLLEHSIKNELKIDPEQRPIFMCEGVLNPTGMRSKTLEVLFETFKFRYSYLCANPVCNMMSYGLTTGLNVDIGGGAMDVTPVFGSHVIRAGVPRAPPIGGRDITEYLVKLLCERGYEMTTSAEREIVRDIKERHCVVVRDLKFELESTEKYFKTVGHHVRDQKKKKKFAYEVLNYFDYYRPLFDVFPVELVNIIYEYHHFPIAVEYPLPDDSVMTIESERFNAPEILFDPSLIGSERGGIPNMILNSIQRLEDTDLQTKMLKNIVLSGGSSCIPGMKSRVKMEVTKLLQADAMESKENRIFPIGSEKVVNVYNNCDKYDTWKGASMIAASLKPQEWITRTEFEEYGDNILRKCF